MWGRYIVTWDAGQVTTHFCDARISLLVLKTRESQELEEIRKARKYGALLNPGDGDEGAFKLRKQRSEGQETTGSKILEYAGGDTYDGEVQQGLKHGVGKYVWANGAR